MRPLSLDFAPRRTLPPGRLLLAAALLLAAVEAAGFLALRQQLSDVERQLAALRQEARPPARPPSEARLRALQAELAQADAVVRRLALPWGRLFESVEQAGDARVALLALEPDAQKRVLRLDGEARSYPDVLAYLARLEQTPALSGVHLTRHEVRQDDPQRPWTFTLAARWEVAR